MGKPRERTFYRDVTSSSPVRRARARAGLRTYVEPMGSAFASKGVDYAQLIKSYEVEPAGSGRYSPPKVTGIERIPVFGSPIEDLVSTSYVERQNLTAQESPPSQPLPRRPPERRRGRP